MSPSGGSSGRSWGAGTSGTTRAAPSASGRGGGPSSPASVLREDGLRVVYDVEEPSPDAPASVGGRAPRAGGHDDAAGFVKGMRVKHAKFGVGRVDLVEAGGEVKLTVYFPSLGQSKRVLADFVQPL